ncbi:metal-dependent phosphohydrolase [Pseudofrankia sp. EUN1h]|nr:metal-dependent phosphohydrolase [Pseudofrankia sp. EUN1h]
MPTLPDSALAVAADELLTTCSPPPLVNHCRRTYLFGTALLESRHRPYDAEALYVAAMLHDLGLTELWGDEVTPFEQRGALVAEITMLERGASPRFAGLVRDAIALHLELDTAKDPRPEVAGVHLGAAVDVLGLRLDQLPKDLVADVLDGLPRLGLKDLLTTVLRHEAEAKPTSRIAGHVAQLDFVRLVAAAPFDG